LLAVKVAVPQTEAVNVPSTVVAVAVPGPPIMMVLLAVCRGTLGEAETVQA
jgi:hypothetical protein